MAMLLAQAEALSQDKMVKGIIQELIKASPLMKKYPFVDLIGNALAINREDETAPPSVAFRAPNGVWTEDTGGTTPASFSLKILGGDCDVDNFLQQTRSDKNDLMKVQVKMKTKQMAHAFDDTAIYGNATGTNEFDGYHVWVNALTAQQVHAGAGGLGGALTIRLLDEAFDLVLAGTPDFILMNRAIRRRFNAYLRSVASFETERDEYGNPVSVWNGIPILVSDMLTQVENIVGTTYSTKTGGFTSSVFLVHLGDGEGVVGLQNGGIDTEVWDKLETKDASRTRIKWYVSQALYATKSIARIDGITDVAVTA